VVAIVVLIVVVGLVLVFGRGEAHQPPTASPAPASETTQRPAPASETTEPTIALPANEPTSAQNTPSATATPPPPTTAVELPISDGLLGEMVVTPSGKPHCLVLVDEVVCHVYCFSVPTPLRHGQPATGVRISADGDWDWNYAGFAPKRAITLAYGTTYRARGWTIEPTPEGMTFTNDATGHGMFVSVEGVEPF